MEIVEVVDALEALVRERCPSLCVNGEFVAWSRAEERAMRLLVSQRRMYSLSESPRFTAAFPRLGAVPDGMS